MGLSLYAKLAAAAILAIVLAAFGWHEYHAGSAAGAAAVQQKWDRETAQVSQATTVAVQAAASDALANYKQAGESVQTADQHQADLAAVHSDLTKRANDYAKFQSVSSAVHDQANGNCSGSADGVLTADGLRIWNDANAAAHGSATLPASDSAGSIAEPVRHDSSTSNTGRQDVHAAIQSCGRGIGAGRMQCQQG